MERRQITHLGPWEYDLFSDRFTFDDHFYALFRTTAEREGGYCMPAAEYVKRFVHPADAEVVGREIQMALESADPHYSRELEHRIVYADGEIGYINVRFLTVKDEAGRIVRFFGANLDITERKRAEAFQEVLQAENRRQTDLLAQIIQETPAGIAFLEGPTYRYTLANPGYLEFVHGKGEILGRTVADVWPEAYDHLRPLLDSVYLTGTPFHAVDMPLTVIREHGPETAHFTFTYTPLRGSTGEVESILVTAQETTDQIQVRLQLEKELAERKRVEAELRASEQRYVGLFEDSPISLWEEDFSEVKAYLDALRRTGVSDFSAYLNEHPESVVDCLARVRVIDVNQEAVTMYRAESKKHLLANFDRIFPLESYSLFREEILAIARGQRLFEREGKNCNLAGELMDIHLRWSVAPGCEEAHERVFISILDITARKKAEALAQKQAAQAEALSAIANALSAASLNAAAIYDIITVQAANLIGDACLLTLFAEDQSQGVVAAFHHADPSRLPKLREILPSEATPSQAGFESQVARTGKPIIIPVYRREEAAPIQESGYLEYMDQFVVTSFMVFPMTAQGRVIGSLGVLRDAPGSPYALEDLSLLRYLANQASLPILNAQLYEQIKRQAQLDPLTGIPNRRHFFEIANDEIRRVARYQHDLSLIMIDIDHFKEINDTYGHDVGDQILGTVTRLCHACLRATDRMGRYGGDEFLILLPETDGADASQVAERIRDSIGNHALDIEGNPVRVTISLGVATKTDPALDLVGLLHQADEAMYLAKREGRNQVKRAI